MERDDNGFDMADDATQAMEREIVEILEKATREPLDRDEVAALCWAAGIDRRLVDSRRFG